jgi:hypothetical protein
MFKVLFRGRGVCLAAAAVLLLFVNSAIAEQRIGVIGAGTDNGALIKLSPADKYGNSSTARTNNFSYNDGTQVMITAPEKGPSGRSFSYWEIGKGGLGQGGREIRRTRAITMKLTQQNYLFGAHFE